MLEGEAAVGLVVEGEQWTTPAVDPLVPTSLDALRLPAILHALSDPVRLRIVSLLAEGGEQTCGSARPSRGEVHLLPSLPRFA